MRKKLKRLYVIAVLVFSVMLLGTAGAIECDGLTFGEAIWQVTWCIAGGVVVLESAQD